MLPLRDQDREADFVHRACGVGKENELEGGGIGEGLVVGEKESLNQRKFHKMPYKISGADTLGK